MENRNVQRIRPPVTVSVSAPLNGHLPALLSSVFASMSLSDRVLQFSSGFPYGTVVTSRSRADETPVALLGA